jgi:hypothetical protein
MVVFKIRSLIYNNLFENNEGKECFVRYHCRNLGYRHGTDAAILEMFSAETM